MIFGNISHLEDYAFMKGSLGECFAYAKQHDLKDYAAGSHEIDGERLYVNIAEYTTTTPQERFWEAHREYLDIHIMLEGEEQIDIGFIENMEQGEYVPKDDFLPMQGEKNGHAVLRAGDFLICYPHDAHRTAVMVDGPTAVKKAIFKLRIGDIIA